MVTLDPAGMTTRPPPWAAHASIARWIAAVSARMSLPVTPKSVTLKTEEAGPALAAGPKPESRARMRQLRSLAEGVRKVGGANAARSGIRVPGPRSEERRVGKEC